MLFRKMMLTHFQRLTFHKFDNFSFHVQLIISNQLVEGVIYIYIGTLQMKYSINFILIEWLKIIYYKYQTLRNRSNELEKTELSESIAIEMNFYQNIFILIYSHILITTVVVFVCMLEKCFCKCVSVLCLHSIKWCGLISSPTWCFE